MQAVSHAFKAGINVVCSDGCGQSSNHTKCPSLPHEQSHSRDKKEK